MTTDEAMLHHGNGSSRDDAGIGALRNGGVARIVVELLESAHKAISRDAREVDRCITEAMGLLRVECELACAQKYDSCARPLAPWQMQRVSRFVEGNLTRTIRIESLAVAARLSTSYFSRAFRRTVGDSPLGYVRRRRVERAQRMILLTDESLAEIALACGLTDQAHLTRLFRRMVGVSPGAWRRMRRATPHRIQGARENRHHV